MATKFHPRSKHIMYTVYISGTSLMYSLFFYLFLICLPHAVIQHGMSRYERIGLEPKSPRTQF